MQRQIMGRYHHTSLAQIQIFGSHFYRKNDSIHSNIRFLFQQTSPSRGCTGGPEDIKNEAVNHFQKFLQTETGSFAFLLISELQTLLRIQCSSTDAALLVAPITQTEITYALKTLPNGKISGPDGYTKEFCIAAWPILDKDLSLRVSLSSNSDYFLLVSTPPFLLWSLRNFLLRLWKIIGWLSAATLSTNLSQRYSPTDSKCYSQLSLNIIRVLLWRAGCYQRMCSWLQRLSTAITSLMSQTCAQLNWIYPKLLIQWSGVSSLQFYQLWDFLVNLFDGFISAYL